MLGVIAGQHGTDIFAKLVRFLAPGITDSVVVRHDALAVEGTQVQGPCPSIGQIIAGMG